jgi:branched-chain amino acid transport system substrate-binding protein
MKDVLRVLLKGTFVLCLVFGLVFVTVGKPTQAAEPIKIGTIFSISGWAGFIGTPQKEVFTAMIEDINAKGGINGRPLEFLYEDDKSVPTNAVIAATKLIKDRGVVAMVGTSISDSALAIVPVCENEKVPFINSGPAKIPFKKYIFSVGPGDVRGASHLLEYAVKDLKAKKLALFHDAAAYGKLGQEVIKAEVSKYPGVSLVIQESMEPADTNVVPQLTKIKSANVDLILLYMTGGPAVIVAKNYKQLGMTTPLITGNAVTMPDFIKNAGKLAEEMKWMFMSQPMMIADFMSPNDPYRKDVYDPFKKLMQAKYGPKTEVNLFHGSSYDAIAGIAAAMKMAPKIDRESIREALERVDVPGFLGHFAPTPADHQAAPVDPMRPMILKDGAFVPYVAAK